MYKKINTDMDFKSRELDILEAWKDTDLQDKLMSMNEGGLNYTVYDGPPTANGKPHIGHVLTRSIKDLIPRYKRMKGYHVEFKAGWDTHGLPVEIEVEKMLGLDGKEDIEAYGVEKFIEQCKTSVWKYQDEWEQMSARLAYSADMENPYITYENNYIESEWWAIKKIWEKDLLYQGFKVVPYCARCGTSLSSHEVAQGYKDVVDTSAFVRFKVNGEDAWFTAWTTTPWTLPSNVSLTVNEEFTYALIELNGNVLDENKTGSEIAFEAGQKYYTAKDLAGSVFGEDNYSIIEELKGADLVGKSYEPILPYANNSVEKQKDKQAFIVTSADYVTLSDGTGIVHTAPAFGDDDSRVGRENNLAFVQLVDEEGKMTEDVTDFAGQWVKDADSGILAKLREEGLLLRTEKYEHNYPHCWRCNTPLIYYARDGWFISATKVRDQLLANNDAVNWYPETVKTGRFGNFLGNVIDWNISRDRYWGTPIPIWQCDCGYQHVIGSIEELKSMSDNCPDDIELHKPYIDDVHVNCPECSGKMTRTPEVMDAWFDSGAMPFAQYHYPFENKDKFDQHFPADFISEAEDQTRGWFYSLMANGTLLFGIAPYSNVLVMGLVQDAEGRKMSKHVGNVVDPWDVLDRQGADAVRWYFYRNSNPWLPSRFSDDAVTEGMRKYMSTVWNTLSFYTMYADIDKFDPTQYELDYSKLSVMDRWLLAKLNDVVEKVTNYLDNFDLTAAARLLESFADELSNWYIRRSRERFWVGEMEEDKINAYMTLYTTLEHLARLSAPFVPFISEEIYQVVVKTTNEDAPSSVHLTSYPEVVEEWKDSNLIVEMAELIDVVQLGRAARNNSGIKNRQVLSKVLINGVNAFSDELSKVLLEELNVDDVEYLDSFNEFTTYSFKPRFATLGKKIGSKIPQVKKALENIDTQAAWDELQSTGKVTVELADESLEIIEEDLEVEEGNATGYQIEKQNNVSVALVLELTDSLIARGNVREIVSKIQNLRKDLGFEVSDRIITRYSAPEDLESVISEYADDIKEDTLTLELINEKNENSIAVDINGEELHLYLEKAQD